MKKQDNHNSNSLRTYNHIALIESPESMASEAYRRIQVGLEYSEVDKEIKVIQVCSSLKGEGKTTTLLNLACAYAETGKKVIALDLDFRRPKLHRTLEIEDKDGITDVLAGNIKLEDAIKHSDSIPFDIINRGSKAPFPAALLSSNELQEIVNTLKNMYDLVLVDCPPVIAVSDAIQVSKLCDGCLFIVSYEKTEKSAAKEAIKILKSNNIKIFGTVITEINSKNSSYYGHKYSYYYQYYGKDSK